MTAGTGSSAPGVKRSAALSTLRQLAVLGLPGPMACDTVARVLPLVVPCELVAFQELDAAGRFVGAWINLPELLPELGIYLEHFHNRREGEAHATFDEFFRSGTRIDKMHGRGDDYLKSALYNELYRQIDFRFIVRGAFRDGGIARGCVMLSRGHGSRDYSPEEIRLLSECLPLLTHALANRPGIRTDFEGVEVDEGHLVCSGAGNVEFVSPKGRALLHDVAEAPMTAATLSDRCLGWAAPLLRRLVGETARLSSGRPGNVPVLVKENRRGRYALRAWRLSTSLEPKALELYSVSIRRYIPLALRLLSHPAVVALPSREKEVCLGIAGGAEIREIAERTGLTANTVISYVRSLYGRFGVSSRGQLLERLRDSMSTAGTAGNA